MPGVIGESLCLPLLGAGGEPVSFRATLGSHGLAWLPPNALAADVGSMRTTLRLRSGRARSLGLREGRPGCLEISIAGAAPSAGIKAEVAAAVRAMFALDDDLSAFYARAAADPELAFATAGVGRLLRSPHAFDDVVRTICTTNCTWSATERMIGALVSHLGTEAPAGEDGLRARAFPTAEQLAEAPESFYRDVARAGYRGAYLRSLADSVASGTLDIESWRTASRAELSDAELEKRLLTLPGVGPYAAAHTMMLFGRSSRLVLDSWTRPRYAELMGKKKMSDKAIARRFKAYGQDAGLAFWLVLWKARHLEP